MMMLLMCCVKTKKRENQEIENYMKNKISCVDSKKQKESLISMIKFDGKHHIHNVFVTMCRSNNKNFTCTSTLKNKMVLNLTKSTLILKMYTLFLLHII